MSDDKLRREIERLARSWEDMGERRVRTSNGRAENKTYRICANRLRAVLEMTDG